MAHKRKLTDEQIVVVVKQLEARRTAAEIAREVGVSTYMIYAWKLPSSLWRNPVVLQAAGRTEGGGE
jgi:hypothetical protein